MAVSEALATGMKETNERFCRDAIGGGDNAAWDRIYTRNAKVLPPGAPMIEGIDAIKAFWAQAIAGLGLTAAKLTLEASRDMIVFAPDVPTEVERHHAIKL